MTVEAKQWAKIQESMLKAQLKIIREFLRQDQPPSFKTRGKRRSHMSIIYDILQAAGKPLHVSEIMSRAKENFNVELQRESIVSALTKKVNAGRTFKRVAPNTFAIIEPGSENSS
jgi:predicted transcriptional regulator